MSIDFPKIEKKILKFWEKNKIKDLERNLRDDMVIEIPASITYEQNARIREYKWKTKKKISRYFSKSKRIFLRISSMAFGTKPSKLPPDKRQVKLSFLKKSGWTVRLFRIKEKNLTLQCYPYSSDNLHSYIQIVINKSIPRVLLKELQSRALNKKCVTIPVKVKLDINEWKDVNLQPEDFLYHTEIHAKELLKFALKQGFKVNFVPKGREYDLKLIGPKGTEFIIAILSHKAKYETRSKQHRIQKTLLDIAKMIPTLFKDKFLIPVIISQPYEFKNSWSFTTKDYLDFYKNHFNFKFLHTNFGKNWPKQICQELKNLDSKNKRENGKI